MLLPSGETVPFASVEDTPLRMGDLATWIRQEQGAPTVHPVAFAAKLHHDFVRIHPFGDGNGRVARLLVNYVLMRSGYLPTIVRTEDKTNYLTALRLADAGELTSLITYFYDLAEWSQKLGIKAAKGESIEEPGDLEKEISLFVRQQEPHREKVVPRSGEVLRELYELSFKPFLENVQAKMAALNPLFTVVNVVASGANSRGEAFSVFKLFFDPGSNHRTFELTFVFRGYRGAAKMPFDIEKSVRLDFAHFNYSLSIDTRHVLQRLYSEPILGDEASETADRCLRETFEQIKSKAGA